jgi:hypothetical protein
MNKGKGTGVINAERMSSVNKMSGAGVEYMDDEITEVPAISYRGSKGTKHKPAEKGKDGRRATSHHKGKVRYW